MATPAPAPRYSIRGTAIVAGQLFAEPLQNVTFELRALDGTAAADLSSGVQVAQVKSNAEGEFAFNNLSTHRTYRIRPIAAHYDFSPAAITITRKEVEALGFQKAVIDGFVFERREAASN